MTIAICYPTDEGVVMGADSATTVQPSSPQGIEVAIRHFNHAQKLFEVGKDNKYGHVMIATWGLGNIGEFSHRTLVAEFSDVIEKPEHSGKSIQGIANIWNDLVWGRFSTILNAQISRAKVLSLKVPTPGEILELQQLHGTPNRDQSQQTRLQELESKKRTASEDSEFGVLANMYGGYFVAGRRRSDRVVEAYRIDYHWESGKKPIARIPVGTVDIQGVNLFVVRLLKGIDPFLLQRVAADPRWAGTEADLESIASQFNIYHGYNLPLRDAIEMVYSFIYCTIKAIRFSRYAPICGGPIEIATVTTDRDFRWVSHKDLDVAVHQALFNETRHA